MRRATLALTVLLALGGGAVAQSPEAPAEPQPGGVLRDRDFGVSLKGFGLDRRVEMYQWTRDRSGYRRVWNDAPIDSSSFEGAHSNPDRIPLRSRRWWSEDTTLAGRPVDVEVLQTLGRWEVFRPDFAQLPGNLAASFQPEGDGLGSSDDPSAPVVGDLRIRWRKLVLPSLLGRVQLRDGVWRLTPKAAEQAVLAAADPTVDITGTDEEFATRWWPWLVAATAAALALVVVLRKLWWRLRAR